jgi:hypothetical protein
MLTSFYYNIAVHLSVMFHLGVNVIWGTEFTDQTHWNIARVRHTFLRAFSVQSYDGKVFEIIELP